MTGLGGSSKVRHVEGTGVRELAYNGPQLALFCVWRFWLRLSGGLSSPHLLIPLNAPPLHAPPLPALQPQVASPPSCPSPPCPAAPGSFFPFMPPPSLPCTGSLAGFSVFAWRSFRLAGAEARAEAGAGFKRPPATWKPCRGRVGIWWGSRLQLGPAGQQSWQRQ